VYYVIPILLVNCVFGRHEAFLNSPVKLRKIKIFWPKLKITSNCGSVPKDVSNNRAYTECGQNHHQFVRLFVYLFKDYFIS
jgi:hypothetical protein